MAPESVEAATPISPGRHGDAIRAAVETHGKSAWCYYVPFLCCYSLPPGREVRVVERDGALCLLVVHEGRRGRGADLMVPPLPLQIDTLQGLADELRPLNQDRPPRILWVDGDDRERLESAGFEVRPKEREYLYVPHAVADAQGRGYRDLRKRLRRFDRSYGGARFRRMEPEDAAGCHALLKHWRRRQGRRHPFLLDWGYTRAAVDRYADFSRDLLEGWCVEVGSRIAAFAMAGPIREGLASFFVAKADPELHGLSEYLRWRVFGELSGWATVNDAGDLDLPGIRQHKAKFRPVEYSTVFTAIAGATETL